MSCLQKVEPKTPSKEDIAKWLRKIDMADYLSGLEVFSESIQNSNWEVTFALKGYATNKLLDSVKVKWRPEEAVGTRTFEPRWRVETLSVGISNQNVPQFSLRHPRGISNIEISSPFQLRKLIYQSWGVGEGKPEQEKCCSSRSFHPISTWTTRFSTLIHCDRKSSQHLLYFLKKNVKEAINVVSASFNKFGGLCCTEVLSYVKINTRESSLSNKQPQRWTQDGAVYKCGNMTRNKTEQAGMSSV